MCPETLLMRPLIAAQGPEPFGDVWSLRVWKFRVEFFGVQGLQFRV